MSDERKGAHRGDILIVDDQPGNLAMLSQLLGSEGYRVRAVTSGERAIEAARLAAPDCVLLDIAMPGMDGIATCAAFRADARLAQVPVIFLTAFDDAEHKVQAFRAGGRDYVSKPFQVEEVLARIDSQMQLVRCERQLRQRNAELIEANAKLEELHEQKSRVQESRFRALVEKSQDGISMTARDGTTIYLSPAGRRLLGFDPESTAVNVTELWHPDEVESVRAKRDWLLAHPGASQSWECRLRRSDGEWRWFEIVSTNLLEDGSVGAVINNFRDVTERHRALADLRASEARFRALTESGVVGIAISVPAGAIVDANDAFLTMVGYSRADLTAGLLNWRHMSRPDAEADAIAIAEVRARGFATPWEKEYTRKDGSRVSCLVGVSVIDAQNNIILAIDLSERKQIEGALQRSEGQLRHAQKMDAVGRLAGGVAHDFNNVLSVILSYVSLIGDTLKPGDPMREDIEEIGAAAQRAADLTRQLLLFSRQQVVETKVLDLNQVLGSMSKMVRRLLGEDVEVVSVAGSPLAKLRCDPGSLEQVVMNLVVNARDAMPGGGTVTLETANVALDDAFARTHLGVAPGRYVMLAVTDTGVGMDQATQSRIFEPFFTTKGQGKGTGLGLSIVFGIVQQAGGTVWVESEQGKGACFKIYLPVVEEQETSERPIATPMTFRGTETILLVEDEEQVRVVARGILRRNGYEVLEARDGGEALLISERHGSKIHLLLSDVVMPKMSGPELARRLAEARPDTRVLCISGYTDDSVVRHGLVNQGIPLLQKPFTPQTLTRRVREVLDGDPARGSPGLAST